LTAEIYLKKVRVLKNSLKVHKEKGKSMFQEFKKFALKGNVLDLAVGVIIGGAFGKIVTSLVNDIIMPLLGVVLGQVNLKHLKWQIREAVGETPELAVLYGAFLQNVLDFLIISASVYIFIRIINSLKKKEEEKPAGPPKPTKEEELLTEIRDLLKSKVGE
jgi:large conductance mechanosensitive channel